MLEQPELPLRFHIGPNGLAVSGAAAATHGGWMLIRNANSPIRSSDATGSATVERNFASDERLRTHFEEHGAEFGHQTEQEYLAAARQLTNGGEGVEQLLRANGDTLYYWQATNEFGVVAGDGTTIRTYFAPREARHIGFA